MSTMYGADVAELRRLSAEFHAAANELDRDGGMMTRLLNSVDWVGGVASRFTSQWTGVQLPRIGLSTRFLREAADELSRNADQQERASRSSGRGGSHAHDFFEVTGGGARYWAPRGVDIPDRNVHAAEIWGHFGLTLGELAIDGYENISEIARHGLSALDPTKSLAEVKLGALPLVGAGLGVASHALTVREHGWSSREGGLSTIETGMSIALIKVPFGGLIAKATVGGTAWVTDWADRTFGISQRHVDAVVARTGQIDTYGGATGFARYVRDSYLNRFDEVRGAAHFVGGGMVAGSTAVSEARRQVVMSAGRLVSGWFR